MQQDQVLVNKPCFEGRTPLLAALDGLDFTDRHLEVVLLLLRGGADPSVAEKVDLKTPLLCAVEILDMRVVQALLQSGADSNQADFNMVTPLHRLCGIQGRPGHELFSVLEALVRSGADVNARDVGNCTPAHNAGLRGHRAILKFLELAGADMGAYNSQFMTPHQYLQSYETKVAEN